MELQKRRQDGSCFSLRTALDCPPNWVASTCVSPGMRNQMHGIPPCSTRPTLYPIGSSPMRPDATKNLALFRLFRCLQIFNIFRLFDFSTDLLFLPSIQLILYRPSLVASNTSSDAPEPLFTSDFHNRCHKHRCRQIRLLKKKSWHSRNSAPEPVPPTTRPHGNAGYAGSYWPMVCRYGHAQCNR